MPGRGSGTTKGPTYVLIAGAGHSGSTLLSLILGSHSRIVSVGEVFVLGEYVRENRLCTCSRSVADCPFWRGVLAEVSASAGFDASARLGRTSLDIFAPFKGKGLVARAELRGLLQVLKMGDPTLLRLSRLVSGRSRTSSALVGDTFRVLDAACRVSGKSHVVDSSKAPVRMKRLYLERPGQTKVIYLVRDGRGFIESAMRRKKVTPEVASASWVRINEEAMAMLESMPLSQKITVKYREICQDAAGTLAAICGFLGLTYEPKMLDFKGAEHHDIRGNVMRFSPMGGIKFNEEWRHRLSERDLSTFREIAGPTARKLGYEL